MKWQKLVIINALTRYSTFTLDPNYVFKSSDLDKFPEKYRTEYSNLIKCFEDPKMLTNSVGQNVEMGLIIKLLQIDFLKECNRYVYLKVSEDVKIEKLYQKNFDIKVYNTLKNYSMKRTHIHEIAWKENISLKEIISVLNHSNNVGTYFI